MNNLTNIILLGVLAVAVAGVINLSSGNAMFGEVNDLGTTGYTVATTTIDSTLADVGLLASTSNMIANANPARQELIIHCASGTAWIILSNATSGYYSAVGATTSAIRLDASDTSNYYKIGADNLYKGMVRGISNDSGAAGVAWITTLEK